MKSQKSFAGLLCLLLAAMTVLALTGCGSKAPKSAADLMKAYSEKAHDNYNMKMNMDMFVNMDFGGGEEAEETEEDEDDLLAGLFGDMKFEIPMNITYDVDCAGAFSKGSMQIQAEMFGEQVNESMELYLERAEDATTTYIQVEDDWIKTTDESYAQAMNMAEAFMKSEQLQNAEFTADAEERTYTIKLPFGELMKGESAEELLGAMQLGDIVGEADELTQGMLDAMSEKMVTFTFDQSYNLLSFEMEPMEYSGSVSESGLDMNVAVSLEMKAAFDQFDQIKEEDVKVPQDVKDNAKESEAFDFDLDDEEMEDWDWDFDEEEFQWDDDETKTPNDYSAVGEDLLGAINGKVLTAGPNDSALFTDAGFEFDLDGDGEYPFAVLEYPKNDMVSLYLTKDDYENVTVEEIKADGFNGYEISVFGEGKLPKMTWGGLTFGASYEDIVSVYGEPDYKYEGDDYISAEYHITDEVSIEFSINTENTDYPGIYSVEVRVYR